MKDFLILVKAVRASSLTVNRTKKGKTVRQHSMTLSMILVGILIAVSLSSQFMGYFTKTLGLGISAEEYFPYIAIAFASYILYGFFLNVTFAVSIYFKGNNDIFLSLPISGNRFFLAKLVLCFFMNLAYGGIAILDVNIMTCIFLHLGLASYLIGILLFILYALAVPCLSFVVVNFFSGFLNLKNGKYTAGIFTGVSTTLAVLGILAMSLTGSDIPTDAGKDTVISGLNRFYHNLAFMDWLGYLPARSILGTKASDYLMLLALLSIIALIVFLSLVAARRNYLSHLGKTFRGRKKKLTPEEICRKNEREMRLLSHPHRIALRRELSLLRSEKGLMANGIIMPLTMMASTIGTLIALSSSGAFEEDALAYQLTAMAICLFTYYFNMLPAVSLSLEKKDLAYLKTLPIERRRLVLSKLMPSLFINYPFAAIVCASVLLLTPFSATFLISMLLLAVTYPMAIMMMSFFLGVRFPNFNYDNISDLVKKGGNILLSHLAHIGLSIVGTGFLLMSYFIFRDFLVGAIIDSGIYLGLAILYLILSEKRLRKLWDSEMTF